MKEPKPAPAAARGPRTDAPVVSLRGVACRLGGRPVLRGVDWEVRRGEHWAVLGLNGSGKTTLLRLLAGYAHPDAGADAMTVLGAAWGRADWRELRRRIGLVSAALQERFLPGETAEEIVLSGLYATLSLYDAPGPARRRRARALLGRLGAAHVAGRPYGELSQGERQKVLIARALVSGPELLLLDEPCAGLDLFSREDLLAAIGALAEGEGAPTMVIVSHHVEEILPAFAQTLLLRAGAVVAAGPTREVLTAARLTGFFGRPVEVRRRGGRSWVRPLAGGR
jgi:iron complex transport system ATP-binding protein